MLAAVTDPREVHGFKSFEKMLGVKLFVGYRFGQRARM
jgi:hypothetical protein